MKKRIYIAYTGGTIGMMKTADGYAPMHGYLGELLATLPELQAPSMPDYTIHEYETLLDSANMNPSHWVRIAQDIHSHYDDYDGFVILHGTDTMAYSASALAFMLEDLSKPVIFTGSQIPLVEVRNDARENIITALLIAAHHPIPEVCLYFGGKLLRGCRAVKVHSTGLQAFDSPNFPSLGIAGVEVVIDERLVRPAAPHSHMKVQAVEPQIVAALRLFPGLSASLMGKILEPPLRGLVLETYGVGNGPGDDRALMDALREATARGVVIVNCTQCLHGQVNQRGYETGTALAKAGVISGGDMTTEAALAKLYYLFSAGFAPSEVSVRMRQNLRGELSADC